MHGCFFEIRRCPNDKHMLGTCQVKISVDNGVKKSRASVRGVLFFATLSNNKIVNDRVIMVFVMSARGGEE